MKSYFNLGTIILLISLFSSCQKDVLSAENFIEYDITEQDIFKIQEIEYDPSGLKLIGLEGKNDTTEKYYILGKEDVMISYTLVDEMVKAKKIAKQKNSKSQNFYVYTMPNDEAMYLNYDNQVAGVLSIDE